MKLPGLPLIFGTLVFMLTLLAACSGDDDDASPTSTPEPQATTSAEPTTAAAPTEAPAAGDFPLSIVDSSDTEVVLEEAPQRIVSYSPAATEILFAIGAGDLVVGVDEFSNFPPEVDALPKLSYSQPPPEPVIGLEPDLVIFATNQESQLSQFRDVGLTVLLLREPESLEGVVEQIELIGRAAGHREAAEELAAEMRRRIADVEAAVAGIEEGPLVFYELTPDLFTVAPDSFIGAMLTLVKARNVAEGATTAFPQLSAEVLLERDPDVILLADSGVYGGQTIDSLRERPGWSEVAAVQNEQVYEIDPDLYSRPGPRVIEALEDLIEILYPEE